MDRTACMRHCEEDLIWQNRLQNEEWNLNQRARQLDVCEAHLRRHEHRCDRREADLHAVRLRGRGRGHSRVHWGRLSCHKAPDVLYNFYFFKTF
jgi:hypothetical protein